MDRYPSSCFPFLTATQILCVRNNEDHDTSRPHGEVYLLPGDISTVLVSKLIEESNWKRSVLVSRIWKLNSDICPYAVIWLSTASESYNKIEHLSEVLRSPIICSRLSKGEEIEKAPTLKGILASGECYYVYRFPLYCDEFNARSQLFPKGSVGGRYLLPLDLFLCRRRSALSICTISLSQPPISTNVITHSLRPHTVR